MNLDEAQKASVRAWIESGLDLSEIQSKLDSEFGVSVTYMEVRFLVDDLGVIPKDPEPEPEPEPDTPASPEAATSEGAAGMAPPLPEPTPGGEEGGAVPNVSVTVDQITRAGALASGSVTFSDGKKASWSLDQMGRLGLSSEEPGYKPPQEDVMEFQMQLQKKLSGPGF